MAVLTVAKAGAILTYKLGTGLVVARRSDGTWSAPSSILSLGLGWGAQVYKTRSMVSDIVLYGISFGWFQFFNKNYCLWCLFEFIGSILVGHFTINYSLLDHLSCSRIEIQRTSLTSPVKKNAVSK